MNQQEVKVSLRQIEQTDAGTIRNLSGSPFRNLLEFPMPASLSATEDWISTSQSDPDSRFFIITAAKGNTNTYAVGLCGLAKIDWPAKHASLFFAMIDKDKYRSSIQTHPSTRAALGRLIRYGFKELGLNRLYIEIAEHNESRPSLEDAGFVVEGVRQAAVFLDHKMRATLLLSITATEYEAK